MSHEDYIEGYYDGRDRNSPEPNQNRSERYRHSFAVGRAEINGNPIAASVSRENVKNIETREADNQLTKS